VSYDYNKVNQLTGATPQEKSFLYDAAGNMTQGYTPEGFAFTAEYDGESRLVVVSYADGNGITNRTEYTYSGTGFLAIITKYVDGVLASEQRIIRDGLLAVQERDSSNAVTGEYVWGINKGGGIGGLLGLRQDSQEYRYLYDGKGNVTALIDNLLAVVASYRYDAFGRLLSKSGSLDQPFMFSTKRYDQQTGLSYYGYRFYNPAIGRWLNRDPLEEAGGINLYGFVQNNPVNFVDPWGLRKWHTPDGTHIVGRPGTIVEPGSPIGTFIENDVASGYTLGEVHDPLVGILTGLGLPDLFANIPTMLPAYFYGVLKDSCALPSEDKPTYFPLLEIKF